MLRKIDVKSMGKSDLGWLQSNFHFSFANYYNPENMNFGVLRVLNDDIIHEHEGFDLHPHKDMEIISYIVDGELSHGDSMGNERTLSRGQVQYMSAGTGVFHKEQNLSENPMRLLQLWIVPDKKGYQPDYGDVLFTEEDRKNQWLWIASNKESSAPVKVNQDVNLYVTELDKGRELLFEVEKGRQAYFVQIEGTSSINGVELKERDSLEVREESLKINGKEKSHILVIEMKLN